MGSNTPHVGERVLYNRTADDSVFARVTRVHSWDCVDLELESGGLRLERVWRVVVIGSMPEAREGRFERLR